MKKIIQKILDFVSRIWDNLNDKTKKVVPMAINFVEAIKAAMDSEVDDVVLFIIKKAIPGEADDILIDKAKKFIEEWIPKVMINLELVNEIAGIEDKNEQLKAVLAKFKLSSDEQKNIIYHGFASLAIEKLSDGKITWSEAVQLSEYYFKNFVKKSN